MADIFKNDVGTTFRITIKDETGAAINLSPASSKKLYIRRPIGTPLIKDLQFVGDGSDGVVQYIIVAGDLIYVGTYTMQTKITLPEGEWYTTAMSFAVRASIA